MALLRFEKKNRSRDSKPSYKWRPVQIKNVIVFVLDINIDRYRQWSIQGILGGGGGRSLPGFSESCLEEKSLRGHRYL